MFCAGQTIGKMCSKHLKHNVVNIILILMLAKWQCEGMGLTEKRQLREKVLEMFNHAYDNYMENAYPADELMPLSCQGRYRGTQPNRGDIDDALGNFSLTLVDTLDTLVVLGQLDKFDDAVRLVIQDVSFDKDIVVSVFETNIRMLGGLLGGHVMAEEVKRLKKGMQWYRGELLMMASDLGDRLLPAFNTTTGIPFPKVNLRHGVKSILARTGHEKDTCTACAGTMILEFAALSRLTGNMIYEEKAHAAMEYLWMSRHRSSDLVGTVINIHNGDWVRRESGIGAGIDSYYEYMLKAYVLLGDKTYLTRFNKHYAAVMKYISQGPMMLDVHMHKPLRSSRNFMDSLFAFWPGLQVLKGDIKPAIEIHEMLYQVTQIHNFLPEAFTTDFRIHWGHHPLRPEFIESTYFIHKATSDPYYLEVGKTIITNLEKYARVACGFAAIKNVQTSALEDQMDSYVMAETFKYLYLLFSEREDMIVDVDKYIFTTEAHLLPLSLSLHPINITREPDDVSYDDDTSDYDRSCPNTNSMTRTTIHYAQNLRSPLKNLVRNHCVKSSGKTGRQRLHAAEFVAGNKDHLEQLNKMGIRIVTVNDGRAQLLHTASEAASEESANDGLLFMQEMIELSKAETTESQYEARVVQVVSPPFLGAFILPAGPSQFGPDFKDSNGIEGRLVKTEPYTACHQLSTDVTGQIALVQRGGCMFIDKARVLQAAGAIGGIVVDNNDGSSADGSPLFAMSGDGQTDVTIPMLFLFHKEGAVLEKGLADYSIVAVRLAEKARKAEDIAKETLAKQGSLMGDVTQLNTPADDEYIKARQDIYLTSFEDIQLQVRSQSIIARWNNGVGVITVERVPVSGLPNVLMEQLEGSANRRATCHKITRLLHGLDSFDRLSDGDGESADRMHIVCTLLQAVFRNDDMSGNVNVESLLSTEEATTTVDAMDSDDTFGERKEQLLKRINTLLTGYVSRQLKELFQDSSGVFVETSYELAGEQTSDLMDPSNWADVARGGAKYSMCEVANFVVVGDETGAPSGVVVGNDEIAYVSVKDEQGKTLDDKNQQLLKQQQLSLEKQQLKQQQLSLEKQQLKQQQLSLEKQQLKQQQLKQQQLKQQLKQQQKLQQKQQEQQQQHTGDSSSDQDSESAKSTASFNVRHSETKLRTSNSRTASTDSENDVSGRKTSRGPGHL